MSKYSLGVALRSGYVLGPRRLHRLTHHTTMTMMPLPQPRFASPAAFVGVHVRRAAPLSTTSAARQKNQIYSSVRNPDSFRTYLSLSTSSRAPLLTFWTASWCSTCRTVSPLLRSLIESGVGEDEGGVAFAEVEFDAPDIMSSSTDNLPMTYMITSIPTLLSFDGGEAQTGTKVSDGRKLGDRAFLEEWIKTEARRRGGRGGGGTGFGGLFQSFKS